MIHVHIGVGEALMREEGGWWVGRAGRLPPFSSQLFHSLVSILPHDWKSLLSWPPATSLLLNPKPLSYLIWQWPFTLLTIPFPRRPRTLLLSSRLHGCSFPASSGSSCPVSVWVPGTLVALAPLLLLCLVGSSAPEALVTPRLYFWTHLLGLIHRQLLMGEWEKNRLDIAFGVWFIRIKLNIIICIYMFGKMCRGYAAKMLIAFASGRWNFQWFFFFFPF